MKLEELFPKCYHDTRRGIIYYKEYEIVEMRSLKDGSDLYILCHYEFEEGCFETLEEVKKYIER